MIKLHAIFKFEFIMLLHFLNVPFGSDLGVLTSVKIFIFPSYFTSYQ